MSKIAIISQAEQGVLIDISGCSSLAEAKQYLTSTLQVSSQFWEGLIVDLNLGPLVLTPEQVSDIQSFVSELGVQPRQIFSLSPITRASLVHVLKSAEEITPAHATLEEMVAQAEYVQPRIIRQSEQPRSDVLAAQAAVGCATQSAVMEVANTEPPLTTYGGSHSQVDIEESLPGFTVVSFPECKTEAALSTPLPCPEPVSTAFGGGQQTEAGFAVNSILPASKILQTRLIAAGIEQPPAPVKVAPEPAKAKALSPQPAASSGKPMTPAVMMMKQTLRSGQHVSHKGHLVIIGDVNPGAEIVADGDITVWGALRGMAHAGANGNTNAEIRALKFEPLQLRIANAIARSPDRSKGPIVSSGPETARIVEGKIRIAASDPE
ncbi:MAG: septum site-determining protein MinC [Candidatus Obscuribacterales bacterium]|nr:septum site-determining protein MinC [Candidatus Obscuribacterales bacterium]